MTHSHHGIKERVTDRELSMFISKRYHWKTLIPDKVYAMALELQQLRFVLKELGNHQALVNKELIDELKKSYKSEV